MKSRSLRHSSRSRPLKLSTKALLHRFARRDVVPLPYPTQEARRGPLGRNRRKGGDDRVPLHVGVTGWEGSQAPTGIPEPLYPPRRILRGYRWAARVASITWMCVRGERWLKALVMQKLSRRDRLPRQIMRGTMARPSIWKYFFAFERRPRSRGGKRRTGA